MIKKDTKVAVLGAGAMGCLFGGLLAEKGLEVHLIDVWKEHVDEINSKGLKMMGHGGDRTIKIHATTCLLYTSPSPRDATLSRMPSSA